MKATVETNPLYASWAEYEESEVKEPMICAMGKRELSRPCSTSDEIKQSPSCNVSRNISSNSISQQQEHKYNQRDT